MSSSEACATSIASHPFHGREAQNICYIRGHRLRHQDLKDPVLIPYTLLGDERTTRSLDVGFVAVKAVGVSLRAVQRLWESGAVQQQFQDREIKIVRWTRHSSGE